MPQLTKDLIGLLLFCPTDTIFHCFSVLQLAASKEPEAVGFNSEPPRAEDGSIASLHQRTAGEARFDRAGGNEGKLSNDQEGHGAEAGVSVGQTAGGQRGADLSTPEGLRRSFTFDRLQQEVHNKRSVGMR